MFDEVASFVIKLGESTISLPFSDFSIHKTHTRETWILNQVSEEWRKNTQVIYRDRRAYVDKDAFRRLIVASCSP